MALNDVTSAVQPVAVDNSAANSLGQGTLVGNSVLPARLLTDAKYARWVASLSLLTAFVADSANLFTKTTYPNAPSGSLWSYAAQKLGMFLHFNMSTFANVEVSTGNESPNLFNPGQKAQIDQWVSVALSMRAKYAVLTVKHHDGFCLWPTATTPHSIASASPWYGASGQQDIVADFVSKFRAAGIQPVLYFSIWDKTFELANPGYTQAAYLAYLKAQLTELLSNYGAIPAIWTDGGYWHFTSAYPFAAVGDLATFIKSIQPNCLLIDNNHLGTQASSDIIEYEAPSLGFPAASNTLPCEACHVMRSDGHWFWSAAASSPKSTSTLLGYIRSTMAGLGSLLLDVPPDNTGTIPSDYDKRCGDIGDAFPTT